MKYMVISDIHGGLDNLNQILNIYRLENCKRMLFLGDIPSYHSSENEQEIIDKLNELSCEITAVSGNCDEYVTGLLFENPIVSELTINNKKILMTHGNLYSKEYLINRDCDIILYGHTHIPKIERVGEKVIINPGSITKSRLGENTFALINENNVTIRNLKNEIISSFNM